MSAVTQNQVQYILLNFPHPYEKKNETPDCSTRPLRRKKLGFPISETVCFFCLGLDPRAMLGCHAPVLEISE